jgi:uncharacterized membrane protein YfcA
MPATCSVTIRRERGFHVAQVPVVAPPGRHVRVSQPYEVLHLRLRFLTAYCAATMRSRLSSFPLDPKLLAIGLGGGLLSGLLGVGGGVVMVPLLVLWAGYAQRDSHAMSLGAIIPISIAGIATYGVAGEVRYGYALVLAAGSILGAQIGARLLASLDERLLKVVFGVFLVGVAVLLGVRA